MSHHSMDFEPARRAERALRQTLASPWVERLARLGYAAKGVVYVVVGVLALRMALGAGGGARGTRGALREVVSGPFGQVMLGLIAVGLCGYVLWRFVQAFMDADRKGSDAKGLAVRGAYAVSGIVYAGLALTAFRILLGAGGRSGEGETREWTAWLLSMPLGAWLVALLGLIVVGVGLFQFYKAYTAKFREQLQMAGAGPEPRAWVLRFGKAGIAARGVVFVAAGIFLMLSAYRSDPGEARGLDGVLVELSRQPAGPWLLGAVAAGLVAYGVFMLLQSKYRRIVTT